MDLPPSSLAALAIGAAVAVTSAAALKARIALSRAKHRSLGGHARMSRLFAGLVPFYEYDEARFFRADDPPDDVAARRRAGFFRLAELYRTRFPETIRQTVDVADKISDLQFTDAYRVPFQFSRFVRTHLKSRHVRPVERRA